MTDFTQRRAAPRFEIQDYVTASFSRGHKRYEAALSDISTGGAGFIIEEVGSLILQPGDEIKVTITTGHGVADATDGRYMEHAVRWGEDSERDIDGY